VISDAAENEKTGPDGAGRAHPGKAEKVSENTTEPDADVSSMRVPSTALAEAGYTSVVSALANRDGKV
jgi:hypothetical protein